MICEYCNTEFKTKSSLNNHKNKAKYCLSLQDKIRNKENIFECNICKKTLSSKQNLLIHKEKCKGIKEKEIYQCGFCDKVLSSKQYLENHTKKCEIILVKNDFKCEYCDKILSTKQSVLQHLNTCDKKKDKQIENFYKEIKELKEELREKEKSLIKIKTQNEHYEKQIKTQNEHYEKQLEKQENNYQQQIKDLQDKLDRIANKAIDKPTTTTNNILTIASPIDFNDIDKAKYIIDKNLDINYVVDGQKGLARFVKDKILTDDDGKLTYLCSDPSRNVFKYKDNTGEIKKDVEAKKLTNYILNGGIRTKSANIGNEWCKDDSGDIDINKFSLMMEQQESIMKLSDDNCSFKKELASITAV